MSKTIISENERLRAEAREISDALRYCLTDVEIVGCPSPGLLDDTLERLERLGGMSEIVTEPETGDFWHGTEVEARYQQQQWQNNDPVKTDADWFWTLSYIVGKALWPGISTTKKLHRIEAAAGMLFNWHAAVKARGSDGQPCFCGHPEHANVAHRSHECLLIGPQGSEL